MLRVLLSAQASAARLSGLLLLPPVQSFRLGPSKWGDRSPGGAPHASAVQGLQRLLEQARSPGELLRWLGQNPTKVRAHHYPVALRRLGQLLGSQPWPPPVEQATLQDLSQLIIRNCPSFDIHTIHVCLHLAVLLGEEGAWGTGVNGTIEKSSGGPEITDNSPLRPCQAWPYPDTLLLPHIRSQRPESRSICCSLARVLPQLTATTVHWEPPQFVTVHTR